MVEQHGQRAQFQEQAQRLILYMNALTTQAVITSNNATVSYSAAAIDISSPQTGTRCVIATQFGEIYVSTTCP